jgi:hypothetical protein
MAVKPTAVPAEEHDLMLSVNELKGYVAEVEAAKARKAISSDSKAASAKEQWIAKLKSEDPIEKEAIDLFLVRLKTAALSGGDEAMIGRFPSELCTDGGRAINQGEKGWPETLRGRPRRAYEFWKEKLQPLGYGVRVQIIEWPEGLPGDVGMYLTWSR